MSEADRTRIHLCDFGELCLGEDGGLRHQLVNGHMLLAVIAAVAEEVVPDQTGQGDQNHTREKEPRLVDPSKHPAHRELRQRMVTVFRNCACCCNSEPFFSPNI